jgi:hypothetical protein
VLCGFFTALANEQQGRHADAIGWFERHKAACGPPACLPKSSTSGSGSCAGTYRRPSCTP